MKPSALKMHLKPPYAFYIVGAVFLFTFYRIIKTLVEGIHNLHDTQIPKFVFVLCQVVNKKPVDEVATDWELSWIDIVNGAGRPDGLPEGARMDGVAERSFHDELDGVVNSNLAVLAIGSCLIFVYIGLVLGRLNLIQQRVSLCCCSCCFF